MDNQHKQIKGYRDLSQEEIDLMNEIKAKGAELGELVEKLRAQSTLDQRWISIGATSNWFNGSCSWRGSTNNILIIFEI